MSLSKSKTSSTFQIRPQKSESAPIRLILAPQFLSVSWCSRFGRCLSVRVSLWGHFNGGCVRLTVSSVRYFRGYKCLSVGNAMVALEQIVSVRQLVMGAITLMEVVSVR